VQFELELRVSQAKQVCSETQTIRSSANANVIARTLGVWRYIHSNPKSSMAPVNSSRSSQAQAKLLSFRLGLFGALV
jgi:hypothetical protein